MDANAYQVIYKGEILAGFEKEAAFWDVARIMGVSSDSAAKIINGQRIVLKKGLDEATAGSQCILLKKAGLRVALGVPQPGPIEHSTAPPPSIEPMTPVSIDASKPMGAIATARASFEKETIERDRSNPAATATPARIPFEFNGSGSEYFRIWIVNILLTIVTLGIYSAWAKVRNKQYFYG